MAYIGKTPTPAPLTSSDIASDIINSTHIGDTAISGFDALSTEPADTDEFLISDAGVLKRLDASLVGGGGAFELISTTTVSTGVASVDFSTLSTDYTDFKIIISGMHPATNGSYLQMLVKKVGDSSFETASGSYYYANFGYDAANQERKLNGYGSSASNRIEVSVNTMYGSSGVDGGSGFEIDIYDVHSTTHKKHGYMKQAFYETEFDYVAVGHGAFQVVDNSALQAFQLKMSSGNINAGYFSLYGRKR